MKKTIATILATVIALSTAIVALAKDTPVDNNTVDVDVDFGTAQTIEAKMGSDTKAAIYTGSEFEWEIDPYTMGALLKEGFIRIDVDVVSGRSYLAAAPTVKVVPAADDIALYASASNQRYGDLAQLKFKINHTYGTKDVEVGMKIRITALKSFETYGVAMNKGDTLTGEVITFKAKYGEVTAYGEDMTLTKAEVKDNFVLAKGEKLYDASGDGDKITVYFDNFAAFTTKVSAAQKDINLYYTIDEISDVTDAYPSVDFEFITFKGTPSFSNRGELTFNAIGGKNTKVYSYANGELTELDGEYDSTYGIVTVDGVKTLGSYVIASEALEVEEEPAAPSTPAVEEENPNTGAC